MANDDSAQYVLRWNEITPELEFKAGLNWIPTGVGLVDGINQLTGDVTAGPGTGSVAAIVHSAGGGTGAFSAGEISASGLIGTAQPFIFTPSADSVTAFQIRYHSGSTTPVISVDTLDQPGNVGINTASPNRTLQVIGNASVSTDFLASTIHINGGFFYLEGVYSTAQIFASPSPVIGDMAAGSDTGGLYVYNGSVWQNISPVIAAETGTGTVTPVATGVSTMSFTVSGNLTINGPSGGYDGQKITLRVVNDGSHSVTLATGSGNFSFGTTITSYTNSVSTIDYIGVIWNASASGWHVVSLSQGF